MSVHIEPAPSNLRAQMFRTRERDSTDTIFVSYTNTPPDPRIDVRVMDDFDAHAGHFGLTYHYLIKTDGTIQEGRPIMTIAAQPKNLAIKLHCIAIGIVGGRDPETYELEDTITTEQEASLEDLMQHLADTLQVELTVEDRVTDRAALHAEKMRLKEQRRRLRNLKEDKAFCDEFKEEGPEIP